MKTTFGIKRLDYKLHDFTRLSWVSDAARAAWEPRIRRIVDAWRDLEYRSVILGMRPCTLQIVSEAQYQPLAEEMGAHGLTVLQLDKLKALTGTYSAVQEAAEDGAPVSYRVVIGAAADVLAFKVAWSNSDQIGVGRLLGIPHCCAEFFQIVWDNEGFVDTTWPMAYNTALKVEQTEQAITVEAYPATNILLRWLGPRAVTYLPCRFDCEASAEIASAFVDLGRQSGYDQEMDWLGEMLNWPVEWTALHGIAEIKTPVVKISSLTDATPEKYTVRYLGTNFPDESAQGLGFPYTQPAHLRLSESSGYKSGLSNPIMMFESRPDDDGANSTHH